MNPEQFAKLWKAVESFIQKESEADAISFWVCDNLSLAMARAAEQVYNAAKETSEKAEENA